MSAVRPAVHVQYNHCRSRKSIRTNIPMYNLLDTLDTRFEATKPSLRHVFSPRRQCCLGKKNGYCVPVSHTHRTYVVAAIVHSAQNVNFSLNSSSRRTKTARQKNFFQIYVVELSKLYRMIPESWRSAWALYLCHFFREAFFVTREKRVPLYGYHGAHGRLRFIKQT